MPRKSDTSNRPRVQAEIGGIRKSWNSRISIVLAYPNRYHVGMSNLGFLTLYRLFNSYDHVVCERVFLPDDGRAGPARLTTMESGRPVAAADIIAFSLSFENDYPHVLAMLENAGLPLRAGNRNHRHPLVIAGGVACFLNPEPLSPFIDCFLIGEAEEMLDPFFRTFERQADKKAVLRNLARNVPGAYVPAFYQTRYKDDGTLADFKPVADVPDKIKRVYSKDLDQSATCSSVVTADTTFGQTYLVETGRGCPHGCRFCSAGFIYRPPRFRSIPHLEQTIIKGARITDRIGLVGSAVSDLPGIEALCSKFRHQEIRLSFSSLRADRLTDGLIAALNQSKVKTATIAPEVGSQRLRQVINKGITETDVLNAAATLVEGGIANLKLYFMVGLPTETEADVDAIIALVKKIKHRFLTSSRARKRIGTITVSLNSFVPKPFTPFQWAPMDDVGVLKK
ncbi:MAG: radical SAM protein, partial [Desulfobacterales bacterium]